MDARRRASDVRRLETGNASLIKFIRERIRAHGPVTFAWFMEQALYHPEHGYYSSGRATIGREGDYFTNVSVGPLFGELMALQFTEMWNALGAPAEFTIVEQGAHDGQFARDVLAAAERSDREFFDAVRYTIIEPFAALRGRQKKVLIDYAERVTWSASLEDTEAFCGVHFSNELIDAMPVHVVRWTGAEWFERYVVDGSDGFEFAESPITNREVQAQLSNVSEPPTIGYETEVNLAALRWVDALAHKLTKGFAIAVDYGFARHDFYAPHRSTGTLQCRAQQQLVPSPLVNVGEADITAHVEWTSVAERSATAGLQLLGFTDQHHFITGLLAGPAAAELRANTDAKRTRALQTLLHPGFLGMKFQYLVLAKGVDPGVQLSGLRFARDSAAALGL